MPQDIDSITSPSGAREAFNSLITAYRQTALQFKNGREDSIYGLEHRLQALPMPDCGHQSFREFRRVSHDWIFKMSAAKTDFAFNRARDGFYDSLRDILGVYFRTDNEDSEQDATHNGP